MEIKLTDDQLRSMVTELLFEKISEADRKEMISGALRELMKPTEERYGVRGPSRLNGAVQDALFRVACTVCGEEFAKEETRALIRGIVQEALAKTLEDRERLVNRVSSAISSAMCRDT